MLFNYKIIDTASEKKEGSIEAVSIDSAVNALQKRGFVITYIVPVEEGNFLAQIESNYGNNLANMTTEEANTLAQLLANKGAALAGTRDTQGLMPLIAPAIQGGATGFGAKMAT